MKYLLIVYMFIGGQWIPGDQIDGWSPREHNSLESCQSALDFATKHNKSPELFFFCEEKKDG